MSENSTTTTPVDIKAIEEALKAQLAQIEATKKVLADAQRQALITEGVTLRDEIRAFVDENLATVDVPTLRKIKALMVVPTTTPVSTPVSAPTTTTSHTSDEAKAHKRASAKLYILNQARKDQGLPKVSFADYWAERSAEFLAA